MKRRLLIFIFFTVCSWQSYGQSILVNRYFNSASPDGTGDVVELVVVHDHLDIRKWIIKDHGNGGTALDDFGSKFRFNNVAAWSDLRSGTTIVIRKLTSTQLAAYTPDVDGSDFKIDVAINDVNYFTDMAPARAWNFTTHELVLIRSDTDDAALADGAEKAVHALGYGDFMSRAPWYAVKSPKALFSNGEFTTTNTANYTLNTTEGVVALTNPNASGYTTPYDVNTPLVNLPSYWVKQTNLMTNMPLGIEVYKTTTDFSANGGPARKMNTYSVVFDPKLIEFKPTYSATFKTPQAFVSQEAGTVYACLNGGFFFTTPLSMIRYNGTTNASNVTSLTRSVYNNTANTYYPTRATFGISPAFKPDVAWTYAIGSIVYSYPVPSPNNVNLAPQPQPTATGGVVWNAGSAIGGAPMLVKDGVINMTAAEELADLDNTIQRARSAIGYTATGKVILVAVEGGNSSTGVLGLTLLELAALMKDMGCVGAINLDGGGSTALRINNQSTVRPSDSGNERTMPGVILIKSKN